MGRVTFLFLGTLLFVSNVLSQGYTPIHQPNTCAMYKECGSTNNPLNPGKLNCLYNGPAVNVRKNKKKKQKKKLEKHTITNLKNNNNNNNNKTTTKTKQQKNKTTKQQNNKTK